MGLPEAEAPVPESWAVAAAADIAVAAAENAQCVAVQNSDDAAASRQACNHLENVGEGATSSFPVACPASLLELWAMCYEADIGCM